jgi:hypothetical protein
MPAHTTITTAVQQLCERYGGRVTLLPGGGVRLLDCPLWPAHATAWLRLLLPDSLIAIESSASSLSGFAIVITRPPPPLYRWPRILFALGALALAWCAATLVRPPRLSEEDEGWWAQLAQNCSWRPRV